MQAVFANPKTDFVIQHVFLELPKYTAGADPQSTIDRWAFLFREAENLDLVPPSLSEGPFREALEVARIANLKPIELEIYDRERIAEQDAPGRIVPFRAARRNARSCPRSQAWDRGPLRGLWH